MAESAKYVHPYARVFPFRHVVLMKSAVEPPSKIMPVGWRETEKMMAFLLGLQNLDEWDAKTRGFRSLQIQLASICSALVDLQVPALQSVSGSEFRFRFKEACQKVCLRPEIPKELVMATTALALKVYPDENGCYFQHFVKLEIKKAAMEEMEPWLSGKENGMESGVPLRPAPILMNSQEMGERVRMICTACPKVMAEAKISVSPAPGKPF